ncbi:hypothetical protein ACFWPA_07340 [Rhodococcus sp. NPDC058505]|uniref:hypothetical protein n=1 Tax=unclassified Rhodococcus (in: high G+C Gram-positive bacteria) TaxID=192944 RepID=UPI0036502A4A
MSERTEPDDGRERPAAEHTRPSGVSDAAVAAAGRLSEALETVERARGQLYTFHQLIGHADRQLGEAVDALRAAGHAELAAAIDADLVGRNVIPGRWTFQLVEAFDDGYWTAFRRWDAAARDALLGGRRHVHEAEMKEARRTHGRPGHEARPAEGE